MSQETGKDPKDNKGDQQETVESLKTKLQAANDEKAALLKETMGRKEKLEQLEKEKQKEADARLAEQGKYKELYESLNPKAQRLDALLPKLENLYELEVKDVPEDKRDLIPSGDVETRLEWVRTAKAKGLFTKEHEKKNPANSVQSKTSSLPGGMPEFVLWEPSDPRVAGLSLADMKIWKDYRANQKPVGGGWAGRR